MRKVIEIIIYVALIITTYSCSKTETIDKYNNGQVRLECEIAEGKRNGKCTGYYPSGKIKFISQYKDDTLNGISKFFHENDQLHWEVNFEKGIKNGKVQYFDSLGRIIQQSSFENNELHGKSFSFYSNGGIKEEMNYTNGYLNGDFKSYSRNGALKAIYKYLNNTLLRFTAFDSVESKINLELKFEQENYSIDSTLELRISVLNKVFDIVGVELITKKKDGTLNLIETVYSETNEIVLKKRMVNELPDTLFLKIIEIENIGEKGSGVARSIRQITYTPAGANL